MSAPTTERLGQRASALPGGDNLYLSSTLTGEAACKVRNWPARIGGVLATAGGLVFRGDGSGILSAYDSESGELLWEFDPCGSVIAPPVTNHVGNTQYVAVVVGASYDDCDVGKIVAFSLYVDTELPEPPRRERTIPDQPALTSAAEEVRQGARLNHRFCCSCHGQRARGYRNADLRIMSGTVHEAFEEIVPGACCWDAGWTASRRTWTRRRAS